MTATGGEGSSAGSAGPGEDGATPIGRSTRYLHWGSALLVASAFALAWTFSAMGPGEISSRLVGIHRSVGLTILLLAIARVTSRLVVPLPPLPRSTRAWERRLAWTVQAALYVCLLAMPVVGWFGSGADADTVSFLGLLTLPDLTGPDQDMADRAFRLHEVIGYAILALTAFHVAGALRHHFVKRDGVLTRMLTGRVTDGAA